MLSITAETEQSTHQDILNVRVLLYVSLHDVYTGLVLGLATYPLVLIQSTQDVVLLVFIFHNLPLL